MKESTTTKYRPKAADAVFRANAKFIASLLPFEILEKPRTRVLDIGCHKCFLKEFLPTSAQYTGINIDKTGDEVVAHDLNTGTLPVKSGHYDLVVCTDLLEHLFYPERIAKEIQRCLAPDGKYLISLPNDLGLTSLLSFSTEWLGRRIDSVPVQTYKHHWKFSDAVARDFFKDSGLRIERATPYLGPYLRPLKPVIRFFPNLCSTFFYLGSVQNTTI